MKRHLWVLVIAFVSFLLCFKEAYAQVVVNEINPSGEWIELFKTVNDEVGLDGCILYFHTTDTTTQKKVFDSTVSFLEDEFYKVINSGGNWLNNSSDTVSLVCPDFTDTYNYENGANDKSFARIPNGSGGFFLTDNITQGFENPGPTEAPTMTPSPTPDPTKTPTPSPTSTATSTPIATRIPTATPKATKKASPSPSSSPEVLGESSSDFSSATTTPSPSPIAKSGSSFNFLPFAFMGAGTAFLGAAFFPFLKGKFKGYNNSDVKDP